MSDGFQRAGALPLTQVVKLAANQTLRTGGLRQQAHQLIACRRVDAGCRGRYAEGLAEQCDRPKDRDILAELAVDGRPAAAQLGVVHARHVIKKQ